MGLLHKKTYYLGLWAASVLAICVFLFQEDKFFAIGGVPIAEVVNAQQDVTYRSEDDTRWKAIAGNRQSVYDGDKLATGKKSNLLIDFKDGRAANVGEDTSIMVSTIKQTSGTTYILSLPKGSVSIQRKQLNSLQKKKTQYPIIIRSGGKDYVIEPGEERGVIKGDKGILEFKGRQRPKMAQLVNQQSEAEKTTPVVLPAIIQEIAKVNVPAVIPPPVAPPVAPKPVVQAKPVPSLELGMFPVLDPTTATTYFTFKPLSAVNGDLFTLKWKASAKPLPGSKVGMEVSNGTWRKLIPMDDGGSFTLKSSDLGVLSQKTSKDGIPCESLTLKPAILSDLLGKGSEVVSKTATNVEICSYPDASNSVPLNISLSAIAPEIEARKNVFTAPISSGTNYQITVVTPSQYLAMLPIISRSKNLKISKSPGMNSSGTFIAKSGKIVAQLAGVGFTPKLADLVMESIKGDFVFKGTRSSLFDATGMSSQELKEWIRQNTEQGKQVYVQSSGSLISIRRDFLEERQEVAQFVREISSQIFTEKVEIVAYK